MAILSKLAGTVASIALTTTMLTPIAYADRGDRDRGNRGNLTQRIIENGGQRANRGERPRAERPRANRVNGDQPRGERPRGERPRAERPRAANQQPRADRPRAYRPNADRGNRGQAQAPRTISPENRVRRGERATYGSGRTNDYGRPRYRSVDNRDDRRADRRAERRQADRRENRQIRQNSYNRGYNQARRDTRNYNRHGYNRGYNNGYRTGYRHAPRYNNYRYNRHVNRAYRHHVPRWYSHFPRRTYLSHNPVYRYPFVSYSSYYTPRYSIGGYYGYHDRTVVIYDYDYYGLYEPPYGYHWVHDYDSGDAVLASITTGAIVGLVVGILLSD